MQRQAKCQLVPNHIFSPSLFKGRVSHTSTTNGQRMAQHKIKSTKRNYEDMDTFCQWEFTLLGFVIIKMMKMSMLIFWIVQPCGLVGTNVSEEHTASIFKTKNGCSMFLPPKHQCLPNEATRIGIHASYL
jgi:hypothetical protein